MLDGLSILAQYASDGTRQEYYTQSAARIDEVLSVVNDDGKFWYQGDALGSIYGLTDRTGALAAKTGHDVFGSPMPLPPAGAGGGQPFGFTGREHDLDAGLVYSRVRYMNPSTGRWDRPDPLGMIDGPNSYSYVRSSPSVHRDPLGLLVELYSTQIGSREGIDEGERIPWRRWIVSFARHTFIRVKCELCTVESGGAYDLSIEIGGAPQGQKPKLFVENFTTKGRGARGEDIAVEKRIVIQNDRSSVSRAGCATEQCVLNAARSMNVPAYDPVSQNSNTFTMTVLGKCGLAGLYDPTEIGASNDPFWDALFSGL